MMSSPFRKIPRVVIYRRMLSRKVLSTLHTTKIIGMRIYEVFLLIARQNAQPGGWCFELRLE